MTEDKPKERRLTWVAILLLISAALLLTAVSGSSLTPGFINETHGPGFDAAFLAERFLLLPVHLAFWLAPSTAQPVLHYSLGTNCGSTSECSCNKHHEVGNQKKKIPASLCIA